MQTNEKILPPDHNRQRKIALINDVSGFGRCSVTVQLPLISALGIQCCPVPTAVFTNHTGFPSFQSVDFTDHMPDYINEWKKLDLHFSGIVTGFLGSEGQIELVRRFMTAFDRPETVVLVDPVMGDYGHLYHSFSPALAEKLHELLPFADILTPNLTEACILAGVPYRDNMPPEALNNICRQLSADGGPNRIVITGLDSGDCIGNYIWQRAQEPVFLQNKKTGPSRSGTGDVFSALVAAYTVRGRDFVSAVQGAADFICMCLETTGRMGLPLTDGIAFEEHMQDLHI